MDVKAIILLPSAPADGRPAPDRFAGLPLALLDVLGRPLLVNTLDRLHTCGVEASDVALIADLALESNEFTAQAQPSLSITWQRVRGAELWHAAERQFENFVENGADVILLIYANRYLELNYEDLIRFHVESRNRITCVEDVFGPTKVFAVNASRRNDAAFLLRHRMEASRVNGVAYHFSGYSVPLSHPRDLRTIVVDAFAQENSLRPSGCEIKPGVWVGEGVCIEKGARLVAPVFIGAGARVCTTAVVTRASNIERNAHIDCGTVVEDSSVLPNAFVGAGLEVTRMFIGYRHVAHLDRNVQVEILDQQLIAHNGSRVPRTSFLAKLNVASAPFREALNRIFTTTRGEHPAPQPAIASVASPSLDYSQEVTHEELWRPVGQ